MGFTKLFQSITESTVWAYDDGVRIVWITMLAKADKNGVVEASVPGLAHVARVSLAKAEEALELFTTPDKYSRTTDHDGRRIEAVDGGWQILNYAKYRAKLSRESKLERDRERQRANRAVAVAAPTPTTVTPTDEAKRLDAKRCTVPCLVCGDPWRRFASKDDRGDFYGHGREQGRAGCSATCPVDLYAERKEYKQRKAEKEQKAAQPMCGGCSKPALPGEYYCEDCKRILSERG